MRELGVDPLTWSFVKLFGQQLCDNVRDWDGLPNSHAWASSPSSRPHRLLTKAQCVGTLVSIHQRAERVELLVDDGTALVRCVQWSPTWDEHIRLGDLVWVEGKLNMDTSWANENKASDAHLARELRVIRISKITDPNEEILHWVDIMELTTQVYSAGGAARGDGASGAAARPTAKAQRSAVTMWDQIVARAFHELTVDDEEAGAFVSRTEKSPHDHVLVDTLKLLIERQRQICPGSGDDAAPTALRVSFPEVLHDVLAKESIAVEDALHHSLTRSLRYSFAKLRSAGLLFLEDPETDRYVLLSAELILVPALVSFFTKKPKGASIGEIAEWVLTQDRFRRVSIDSLERSLQKLVQTGEVDQREDSQKFYGVVCTGNE